MTTRRIDRIWLFGGLGLIVVLVVAGWFLPISTKYAEASDARDRAENTRTRVALLRHTLAELEVEKAKLPTYRAQHDDYVAALPDDSGSSGVPDFLRRLQDVGAKVNVEVSGLSVAALEQSPTVPAVREVPISLTAEGTAANLSRFLKQLQNVQPRAVLVQSANLSEGSGDTLSLSLSLTAFVTSSESTAKTVVTTQ